jgi:hypothetical protein
MTMKTIRYLKSSALTRPTRHQTPVGGILHSLRHVNLKSYTENIVSETDQFSETFCFIVI